MIVMALVAAFMCVNFVACNPEDDNNIEKLVGKWYLESDSLKELMVIYENNSIVTYRVNEHESWYNVKGEVMTNDDEITLKFENGNSVTGTFKVEDNYFFINTSNGEYKYTRLAKETNLVGEWNYKEIVLSARAIKDEIVIPGGTINGVEVPPTVVPTSQLTGGFIDFAAQHYFRNIKFTDKGTMTYSVLKGEEELTMTKNYSIDDLYMTVSGETAGHKIESNFMVLQDMNNAASLLFEKEFIAEMFIGYALMLYEGGVAPDVTEEALEAYRQSFLEAFDYYRVDFRITRAQ